MYAVVSQSSNLETFLSQWKNATEYGDPEETNEVHVSGDMNLDCLGDRWHSAEYALAGLSRLVHACCNVCNFTQLVDGVTRLQYNSVTGRTDVSCIDHVYTNTKHRCSKVMIHSFGDSDHDLISYTRFSKEPPSPARTVRKRSYKNFVTEKYLEDMSKIDWSEVLSCPDLDLATDIFTRKI